MARTCIVTFRAVDRTPVRAMSHEFEDVVAEVDDVDMLAPVPTLRADLQFRAVSKYLGRSAAATRLDHGFKAPAPAGDYEVLLAVLAFPRDVMVLNSVPGWRERSATAVCVLRELWVAELDHRRGMLEKLNRMDHVFVEYAHTVAPLQARLDVPVSFLAPSVDTERFCPMPWRPERSIYVSNVGRRSPDLHRALLAERAARGWFYHYSTQAPIEAWDAADHRTLLAETLMRTRYSVVTRAKFDAPQLRQSEAGFRYFEGAAAGAILVGERVANPEMDRAFDWPDAVVSAADSELIDVLRALDAEPERVAATRRANVTNSLRRHDGAHRWRSILSAAGVSERPALAERLRRLEGLATAYEVAGPPP